jgi:20S proteasome alpha/beta subunit
MTLIVALKYKDGTILSSDRRIIYGALLKRDLARKLEPLGKDRNFGIAGAGLMGAMDEILEGLSGQLHARNLTFQEALILLKELMWRWYCENIDRFQKQDEGFPTFIFVSGEKIVRVFSNGYSEEAKDYACEGSGRPYAEYILGNFYEENLNENEAKELALYTIIETSKMDPNVGEDVDMLVFTKGYKAISEEELEQIKSRISPLTRKVSKRFEKITERVVENRKNIRILSQSLLGFELFLEDEVALWRIMNPCKTEEDFTINICALCMLIDKINSSAIKQKYGLEKIDGSINIFEEFLKKEFSLSKDNIVEIVSILRDIRTLRSKKEPVHQTQSELIQVIINLGHPYPPNWADLWIDLLNKFNEGLEKTKNLLHNKLEKRKGK